MEFIVNFFENITPVQRTIILIGGISFFWIIEDSVPLFNFNYKKWVHAIPNLFFTSTTILINFFLAFILIETSDYLTENNLSLYNYFFDVPLFFKILISIMILDLVGAYLAHFVEHKIKPLWMVHLVHHSDHKVDSTTANRHHPIESIIRFFFTWIGVLICGVPVAIILLYQSISVILSQFNHSNIKLPKNLDRLLSYVIVSPDMHKIHHHYRLPYTDSNYGNIFSIWDRLFGTFSYFDRSKIKYGIDVFPSERKNSSIYHLLGQPFQSYQKPTYQKKNDQVN